MRYLYLDMVYVSCGPESLKRELYLCSENDYVVKSITAVDMFPRTLHAECVCVLEKDDELEFLENLVKEKKKNNSKK